MLVNRLLYFLTLFACDIDDSKCFSNVLPIVVQLISLSLTFFKSLQSLLCFEIKSFASFFSDKVSTLYLKLSSNPSPMPPHSNPPLPPKVISSFPPASIDEIAKLFHASPNKQCDLDPIPTFLIKEVSATILPIITTIVNLSLSTGTFSMQFKQSLVTPLLKNHPSIKIH